MTTLRERAKLIRSQISLVGKSTVGDILMIENNLREAVEEAVKFSGYSIGCPLCGTRMTIEKQVDGSLVLREEGVPRNQPTAADALKAVRLLADDYGFVEGSTTAQRIAVGCKHILNGNRDNEDARFTLGLEPKI